MPSSGRWYELFIGMIPTGAEVACYMSYTFKNDFRPFLTEPRLLGVNSRADFWLIQLCIASSVVYQSSVGIAIPKQKQTILLFGFASNTFLSKLDCAWDLKGSHTIVCKTFSHTGDHTILSFSPNYFPPLMCFRNRQVTPSIGGKKGKVPWMANR